MEEQILALCRAMGAQPDQEELLLPLVRTVREQLAGRLREGVTPQCCGPALPLAAAMMVTDLLAEMTKEREMSSFTAGELTIKRETGTAGGLRQQAERLLAPWTGEAGFAFQGVSG